jgi:hypothetical protein
MWNEIRWDEGEGEVETGVRDFSVDNIIRNKMIRKGSYQVNQVEVGGDYRGVALSIASLGTLLGVLNASTLIIALPTIMVDLNTD